MKKLSKKQKYIAVGSAAIVLAAGSGAAYAYWTSTGSGTSSASTASTQTVTINVTSAAITGLYPGGPSANISGTFTTPNGAAIYVGQVTVAVDPSFSVGTTNPCTPADFTITQPSPTNATVSTGGTWGTATIALKDLVTNQDNCKGVSVPLVLSSN
ncbi:hypothetical protein Back2_02220 [Nocardioides baekrokdamisoli]|uniref:SipW-cognate class signal peptide n=1 Tax=Nocardioides baekrokdamisoli TaxID=1804624 RepID=A0A3G9IIR2_9ACTN|nr:hypothetical protein [Nocardioides baekrokdamisoli]BBH15935.1 hypothetical protein Back2_02220 [Nocardioides baekrokdamisoli]